MRLLYLTRKKVAEIPNGEGTNEKMLSDFEYDDEESYVFWDKQKAAEEVGLGLEDNETSEHLVVKYDLEVYQQANITTKLEHIKRIYYIENPVDGDDCCWTESPHQALSLMQYYNDNPNIQLHILDRIEVYKNFTGEFW